MAFDIEKARARILTEWPTDGTSIIFDTEFTAWEGSQARNWSETWEAVELVEIGAVRVNASTFNILDTFQVLVFPKKNRVLSTYFTDLTSITQDDLEAKGLPLPDAINLFEDFIAASPFVLSNGGDADVIVESFDCYNLICPMDFERYFDIQPMLLRMFPGNESISSANLPRLAGVDFVFRAHEALEDSIAIATALKHLRADGRI